MMNIARRKQLTETSRPLTFEGVPCKVAGWANEDATVTAQFPGFYQTAWEKFTRFNVLTYGLTSRAQRKPVSK
jgi:hypothetical protein